MEGAIASPRPGQAPMTPRMRRARLLPWWGCALLVLAACLSLAVGPTGIGLTALPRAVGSAAAGLRTPEALVLLHLRLPRTILGAFVGAALALSGAIMQGLFRNPLADPGLIGVSSGAALAAVATIALGNSLAGPVTRSLGVYALPCAAFLGGLGATTLLVSIARRDWLLMPVTTASCETSHFGR
jgi:iron complex transport system permease protein